MPASQMTSLRVPEDHLALLDQRIGFDGMRNRSDVIRAAIAFFLESTPTHANVRTVKFDIGSQTQEHLEMLYGLEGITPSEAARSGLTLFLKQHLSIQDELSEILEAKYEKMLAKARASEDHTA
ncbi:MAG: ribbon-helix-helix protein, CopG family [Candidatus Thalassarchaeaceae archaeon]|jgi:Arc/MetJ-type ribon-helix-helix transcriptional regulator|nr:ribbon-helix-helix protein, CopG family [Candidatus Thalassarchaeaceae archaeon]